MTTENGLTASFVTSSMIHMDIFLRLILDDEPAGFCSVYYNTMNMHHFCKIMDLRVKPVFRRKGVARALMLEVLNLAKQLGLDRIKLEVETQNVALELYKSLGFEIEGIEKAFYDDGTDAYIMWRCE